MNLFLAQMTKAGLRVVQLVGGTVTARTQDVVPEL